MKIYYNNPAPQRRNSIQGTKTYPSDKKNKLRPAKVTPPPGNGNESDSYDLNLIEVPGIAFSIPLLMIILGFVKENCQSEQDIHVFIERLIEVGLNNLLDMEDYPEIFGDLLYTDTESESD